MDYLLDDFIFAGCNYSNSCQDLINAFESIYKDLGVPIAEVKYVGPLRHTLEIDTHQMLVRIPRNKMIKLSELLLDLSERKKVTLK